MEAIKITRRTLTAFRELTVNIVCREIDSAFQDEGFIPIAEPIDINRGVRETTTERYIRSANLSDPTTLQRFLKAMETLIYAYKRQSQASYADSSWTRFVELMREDGWTVTRSGKIKASIPIPESFIESMKRINDMSGIQEGMQRLKSIQVDPAAQIGAAKELVESTSKVILSIRGESISNNPKFNELVSKTHTALGLSPGSKNLVDSENSVNRILGGAHNIVLGLNELRNKYGTGHGHATARKGLSQRHATLAINAAILWCDLMLSTFNDESAPWRKTSENG